MDHALQFYINGEWVDPATPKTLDVINPATEQSMGQISLGSPADVDKAVAAAKEAFKSFSQTTREERIGYLEKILEGYKARMSDIGNAISDEMGAPIAFAQGSQTGSGYAHFASVLEALKTYEFESELEPRRHARCAQGRYRPVDPKRQHGPDPDHRGKNQQSKRVFVLRGGG